MSREELIERLFQAGNTLDGHLTNGSLAAQADVVEELLQDYNLKSNVVYAAHERKEQQTTFEELRASCGQRTTK